MKIKFIAVFLFFNIVGKAQKPELTWEISPDQSITWQVEKSKSQTDNIEMSGFNISAIVTYGVDKSGKLVNRKKLVFPMLRTIPNNTHASLSKNFDGPEQPKFIVDGTLVEEFPESFNLKGILSINSSTSGGIKISRSIFPSVDKAALIEIIALKNPADKEVKVEIQFTPSVITTPADKGVGNIYFVFNGEDFLFDEWKFIY